MASVGSTSAETTTALNVQPKTERISTDATPDTESTFTFRANVRRFRIVNRGNHKINLSYTSGESDDEAWTLYPHAPYPVDNIGTSPLSIFLQSSGASQPLEIESWL